MNRTSILTALARVFVAWLMGAMASHLSAPVWTLVNNIIMHIGGTEALVVALVGIAGTAAATVWARLKSRYHLQIALDLPKGSTISDVREASKPMSLTTP